MPLRFVVKLVAAREASLRMMIPPQSPRKGAVTNGLLSTPKDSSLYEVKVTD